MPPPSSLAGVGGSEPTPLPPGRWRTAGGEIAHGLSVSVAVTVVGFLADASKIEGTYALLAILFLVAPNTAAVAAGLVRRR